MSLTSSAHERPLADAVLWRLAAAPEADASALAITADHGVVTLTGDVETYAAKVAAERVARRVAGVRRVVNHLEVRLCSPRRDVDLAQDVRDALRDRIELPTGITATVHNGNVTLTGTVGHLWQRSAADRIVRNLPGVRGLFNNIGVRAVGVSPIDVEHHIGEALRDHPEAGLRSVRVEADGGAVTLRGHVGSWMEKEDIERAVWRVPGVVFLNSQIVVTAGGCSNRDSRPC